jgi:hypothetical protein
LKIALQRELPPLLGPILGGRSRPIVYRHSVFFDGRFVKPDVSLLVALGVTSTSFDRIGAGEEAKAALCVATLVRHFVKAEATLFVTADDSQAP